jgi:4-hydroxybenzoate polyprenyltransferase
MFLLQASIGTLNDLVDVGIDSGRKPGKPIPRGAVSPSLAAAIAVATLAAGLGLSAVSGPATLGVAVAGVGCGYLYDVRLSRTTWSWLPLALALPLVPVHAWLGAVGRLPEALVVVGPVAVLAGAGLALGNGLVDVERDGQAGRRTAVVALGQRWVWTLHLLSLGGAILGAALGAIVAGPPTADWWGPATMIASLLIGGGAALVGSGSARIRERGWELEVLGVALLGVAWLGGLALTGRGLGGS